jgi:DNA-binding MarR family transcriptional regulator
MPKDADNKAIRFQLPRTISRAEYVRGGSDEWLREAIYALVQGLARLLACREAFGRTLGLTATQFVVLMGVAYRQRENGVSIGELAQHVSLARTHVTTESGRLLRKGYLVKRPSPHDGRSVLVSLSPRGEAAVGALARIVRQANDILFAGIAPGEVEVAASVMRRIAVNTESALRQIFHLSGRRKK